MVLYEKTLPVRRSLIIQGTTPGQAEYWGERARLYRRLKPASLALTLS